MWQDHENHPLHSGIDVSTIRKIQFVQEKHSSEDRGTRSRDRSSAAGHPVIRKGLVLTLLTNLQVCEMSGVVRLEYRGLHRALDDRIASWDWQVRRDQHLARRIRSQSGQFVF